MRFVISTDFYNAVYNVSQRLEIKTNELQKAFETCRAFVIGSKSCKISIFENKNRTKAPDFCAVLSISDAAYNAGILTNEIIFNKWIFKMYSPKFEDDFFENIPPKYRSIYLKFLLRNIGLFAESEKNENRQKFIYFLISREGLNVAKTNGALILYNDDNLNEVKQNDTLH